MVLNHLNLETLLQNMVYLSFVYLESYEEEKFNQREQNKIVFPSSLWEFCLLNFMPLRNRRPNQMTKKYNLVEKKGLESSSEVYHVHEFY